MDATKATDKLSPKRKKTDPTYANSSVSTAWPTGPMLTARIIDIVGENEWFLWQDKWKGPTKS
jgi:hypothetical protein